MNDLICCKFVHEIAGNNATACLYMFSTLLGKKVVRMDEFKQYKTKSRKLSKAPLGMCVVNNGQLNNFSQLSTARLWTIQHSYGF